MHRLRTIARPPAYDPRPRTQRPRWWQATVTGHRTWDQVRVLATSYPDAHDKLRRTYPEAVLSIGS